MPDLTSIYPNFPPGFWRRVELHSTPSMIIAGMEDDAHRFLLRLGHQAGCLVNVDVQANRFPWSTCATSGDYLRQQLVGRTLQDVASMDPYQHCTHLYDLAILAAAHADTTRSVRFDFQVADPVEQCSTATLFEGGRQVLRWHLRDTIIEGPEEWAGRELRELSSWKHELTPRTALLAAALRRALFVSGVRRQPRVMETERAGDRPERMGVCYTYQMPRARDARRTLALKDFSRSGAAPLQDFNPESLPHHFDHYRPKDSS